MPWPSAILAKAAMGAAAAYGGAKAHGKYRTKAKARGRSKVTTKRRRIQNSGSGVWIPKHPSVPNHRNVDFVFSEYTNLNTAVGVANEYGTQKLYKLNDPFDPDSGAGAKSVLYWDQYKAFYLRYRVHAVTVEVKWFTTVTDEILQLAVQISNSTSAVDLTGKSGNYVAEMPLTFIRQISPGGEHSFAIAARKFTMAELEGEIWFTRGDTYQALMTGTPPAGPKIRLAASCLSNSVQQTGIYYQITLTYHTRLFDRFLPGQSL